jgi:coenzyme F420-reducing hydrogenase delta subunit
LLRQRILRLTISQLGVEPERFRFEFIAAGCGDKFSQLVAEATASMGALPPRLGAQENRGGK